MKTLFTLALTLLTFATFTNARADACGKPQVSLTLTGVVSSQDEEKVGKDGESKTVTVYYLQTEDEKMRIPEAHGCKKEETAYDLAEFVGTRVNISAKGHIKKSKDDSTASTYVSKIVSIQRVQSTET